MKKLLQTLTILLCSTSALALAQVGDESERVNKIVDFILTEERKIVTEYIQLTEDKARAFWPIFDDYQKTLRKFLPKGVTLIIKYVHEQETLSDEQADAIVDEIIVMKIEELMIKKRYVKKFRSVLPPKEMLKLLQVESAIWIGFTLRFMSETPLVK